MKLPRAALFAVLALGLLAAGMSSWLAREARWKQPLYCLQVQGQVWGTVPVPVGVTPVCPASQTVRNEVRRGESRIEQYELRGWRPAPVLDALVAGGFQVVSRIPDDGIQEAAVLARGNERLTYVADRMGRDTLVSITARGGR
ncbi:hypothetical protein GCM10008955_05760 [Deinococcus malanensis]|uniref:Uncharacterized protein n=1 Tax=Deinococcus malanensis TaxID=1706855 RepID=A0ABQ2EN61_9DEIO|nr:hypothetical protein [Deinococcus malanensis]GGK15221.1 hypothetical protein GCM10008955_05760 [Deinococcus malanensis]